MTTKTITDMTPEELAIAHRKEIFAWLKPQTKWFNEAVTLRIGLSTIDLIRDEHEAGRKVAHFNMTDSDLIRVNEYVHREINNDWKTFTWKRSK